MGSEYFEFYPQVPTAVLLDEHEMMHHALNRLECGHRPLQPSGSRCVAWTPALISRLTPLTWSHDEGIIACDLPVKELFTFTDQVMIPTSPWMVGIGGTLRKELEAPPISGDQPGSRRSHSSQWLAQRAFRALASSSSRGVESVILLSTLLNDMERIEEGEEAQEGYLSFFVRHWFEVEDPEAIGGALAQKWCMMMVLLPA